MKSMVEISHHFLKPALHKQAIAIDATLGQGKDSLFFLNCQAAKVYAFEIQKDLVDLARQKIQDDRFTVFEKGHETMLETLSFEKRAVDAVIFNFGWDPGQKKGIVSNPDTSLKAVLSALTLLKHKGRMALVFYPHLEGVEEKRQILDALQVCEDLEILLVDCAFKNNAPSLALIEKKSF